MTARDSPWRRAHRPIRELPAGEGPYPGLLVADGEGVAVSVPIGASAVASSWRWAGAEHIAAPSDLTLGESATEVLLPWCGEQVATFLVRRAEAGGALGAGEIATLLVSMLRGLGELGREAVRTPARWWLTYDVRPVLVVGDGMGAAEATSAIVHQLIPSTDDRRLLRLLAELERALERPRSLLDDLERWEGDILATAAPRPLRPDLYAPTEVRTLVPPRQGREVSATGRSAQEHASGRALRVIGAWRERGRSVLTRARLSRPPEASGTRSRRPLIAAAAAAGAVLAAGLLWPAADDPVSAAARQREAGERQTALSLAGGESAPGGAGHQAHEAPEAADHGSDEASGDPLSALTGLLDEIVRCAQEGEEECLSALTEGSSAAVALVAERAQARDAMTLVEDYGDIAVTRVATDDDQNDLIIVMVRRDDLWLVRDVYDAVNQPE